MLRAEQGTRDKLLAHRAVWPHTGARCTVQRCALGKSSCLWTATAGQVARLKGAETGNGHDDCLLLCGHAASVSLLLHCLGASSADALLSISEDGWACLWDADSCTCLKRNHLPITPGTSASLLPGNSIACLACSTAQDPLQHSIAVLDLRALEVISILLPAAMGSLGAFFQPEQLQVPASELRILALSLSHRAAGQPILLGISQPSQFLWWSLEGLTPSLALMQQQQPQHSSKQQVQYNSKQEQQQMYIGKQHLECRLGRLIAASFAQAGRQLLLVSTDGWALLQSAAEDVTEGEYAPVFSAPHLSSPPLALQPAADTAVDQQSVASDGHSLTANGRSSEWSRPQQSSPVCNSSADGKQHSQAETNRQGSLAGGQLVVVQGREQQPFVILWDWRGHAVVHDSTGRKSLHLPAHADRDDQTVSLPGTTAGDSASHAVADGNRLVLVRSTAQGVSIAECDLQQLAQCISRGVSDLRPSVAAVRIAEPHQNGAASSRETPGRLLASRLAGDIASGRASLAQAHACGMLLLTPLAALGMSRSGDREWILHQHTSALICLATHQTELAGRVLHVLLCGCEDGCIMAWDVSSTRLIMRLCVHAASVLQLHPAPCNMGTAWDACVASVGADGIVAVVSLRNGGFCQRLLPGHPLGVHLQLHWASSLGFLACFSPARDGSSSRSGSGSSMPPKQALAIVWDLQSGKQDRVATGRAAQQTIHNLSQVNSSDAADSHPEGTPFPLISLSPQSSNPSLPSDISLLQIDVSQLLALPAASPLPSSSVHSMSHQQNGSTNTAPHKHNSTDLGHSELARDQQPASDDVTALATALSLLHPWGLLAQSDWHMQRMLDSLGLGTSSLTAVAPASSSDESAAASLLQDVRLDAATETAVLPFPHSLASQHRSSLLGSSSSSKGTAKHAKREAVQRSAGLWGADSAWLTWRQLALTALAKKLMARGQQNEAVVSACTSVITLVGVHVRELLPCMAVPDAGMLAGLWQDGNESLREAAQMLLAAATDPGAYLHGNQRTAPFHVFALVIALGRHPQGVPSVQLPQLLQQAHAIWTPMRTIAAAAACLFHPGLVPEELIAFCIPRLISVILAAPAQGAAEGAAVLAQGLLAPTAVLWKPHLGDMGALLQRLVEVYDSLTAAATQRRGSTDGQHDGQHDGHARAGASVGEVHKARDGIAALLPAVAAVDLPLFLHQLGHRLATGAGGLRRSGSFGAAAAASAQQAQGVTVLARLLQSRQGPAIAASHLMLLAAVLMQALDPGLPTVRKACVQGVLAVVKVLCMRFDTVRYHAGTTQLAVGRLQSQGSPSSGELIAIYDMETGAKKRSLHVSSGAPAKADTISGCAVLAFSPSGGSLAAFDAAQAVLRMWQLVPNWSQRFQRGTAALLPAQVLPLADAQQVMPENASTAKGWALQWISSMKVSLEQGPKAWMFQIG